MEHNITKIHDKLLWIRRLLETEKIYKCGQAPELLIIQDTG